MFFNQKAFNIQEVASKSDQATKVVDILQPKAFSVEVEEKGILSSGSVMLEVSHSGQGLRLLLEEGRIANHQINCFWRIDGGTYYILWLIPLLL